MEGIPVIPAPAWNELVEKITRALPLSVYAEDGLTARHPWQLFPAWSSERERWEFTIQPGYLNGEDVEARIASELAPALTRERLADVEADTLKAWLSEAPRVPVGSMRAIGRDASATGTAPTDAGGFSATFEPVPAFFRALGVGEPLPIEVGDEGAAIELQPPPPESEPSPLLRACDVVLRKPRSGTQSQWTDAGSGELQLEILSTFNEQNRERAFVFTTARFTQPVELATLSRLLGETEESPFDDIHLGTVFLLSPAGADASSPPDNTWTPYAQSRVFWNLAHKRRGMELLKPFRLTFPLFLAGGVAQPLVDSILATYNTAQAQLNLAISDTDASGMFWTA